MSTQTVKQVINDLDLFNHGVTIAIHQAKNECIATFHFSRQFDTRKYKFEWNDDVTNMTSYHSEQEL